MSGELEIDKEGHIWRVKARRGLKNGGVHTIVTNRHRAEHRTKEGYLQIIIMENYRQISGSAHRLIWQHFFGDIPDGLCINHKNGTKHDNRPQNLEIVTYSENLKHAFKNNLKTQWGEKNPAAKIGDELVIKIRNMYSAGKYKQVEIASLLNIPFQTISKIVRGERRIMQDGKTSKNNKRCFTKRDPKTGRFVKKAAGRILDGRTWEEWPE